jgi:electron transport complex protein RnfE
MKVLKDFTNGIYNENPVFRLLLGMCPTLAITNAAMNGIGMGLATTFVLVGSNTVIFILRNIIPSKIRIPSFIVVIATFVTIVQMVMKGYFPALDQSLGLFIPLIVVNCIILARAESFASKKPIVNSIADGLGMGIGFTIAITLLAAVRELLGAGSIFGQQVLGQAFQPVFIMLLPPGAFLGLGILLAIINKLGEGR